MQRRLEPDGEEAHWWGGRLFTSAKISDFKAQPSACWEHSWLSRALWVLRESSAEGMPPQEPGLVLCDAAGVWFWVLRQRGRAGGKAVPAGWGPTAGAHGSTAGLSRSGAGCAKLGFF